MSALPFVIDQVRPSVVQIRLELDDGASHVVGTGFFIHSDGYVLTARHVVDGVAAAISTNPGSRLMAGLAMPNMSGQISIRQGFELTQLDVVERDPRHDLALLRAKVNPFTSGRPPGVFRTPDGGMGINALYGLARLDLSRPRDGELIAVSGYPLSNPTLITTSGIIASAWASESMEVAPEGAPEGFTMPEIVDSYIADVAVNPGNSGGPVYIGQDGRTIGVCVAFRIADAGTEAMPLRYNSGLTIVVPIQYGVELLRRHASID